VLLPFKQSSRATYDTWFDRSPERPENRQDSLPTAFMLAKLQLNPRIDTRMRNISSARAYMYTKGVCGV